VPQLFVYFSQFLGNYKRCFPAKHGAYIGKRSLKAMRRMAANHSVEVVGARLRDMMPWIKKNRLVDQSKN